MSHEGSAGEAAADDLGGPPSGNAGGAAPERIDGQSIIDAASAPTVPLRDVSRRGAPGQAGPAACESPRSVPPPSAGSFRLALTFPNISGGKPYEASTRAVLKPPAINGISTTDYRISILAIDGLSETGLNHDVDGDYVRIHGTATSAGDHRVRVFFRVRHPDLPSIDGHEDITLTINPDPRSLWKEIEPDPTLPFPKPHTASQRLGTPRAVLAAASQRGRSHAHEGSFRDDDFTLGFDAASGWHYMAVADGAGSAKLSRRGSAVACAAVGEPLRVHFGSTLGAPFAEAVQRYGLDRDATAEKTIRSALYHALGETALTARKAVEREASANSTGLRDYSTTLLLVVCRQFDVGWFAGSFAIGDGGVAVYSGTSGVMPLTRADSGEFAGQTRFLTMAEVWPESQGIYDRIGFHVASNLTAVVAMTDGVSDPKFETDANFADAACWHAFWKELDAAGFHPRSEQADRQLLEWLGFWSVGNHDDRTLAVLVPS